MQGQTFLSWYLLSWLQLLRSLTNLMIMLMKHQQSVFADIHRVQKRLYPFFYFFFLGAQCVESGLSCTDCY